MHHYFASETCHSKIYVQKSYYRYSVVFCDIFIQIKLELVWNFAVAEDFDDNLSTGHCPLHQTDGVGPLGVIRLTLFLL